MKHVTFHLPSFLRRVRIHGGEFDSSARAMNRAEQVRLLQAEPRIVRGSTIERKQMSTKTTFKRIALVAVAALGFGVLSVVPSQANVANLKVTTTDGTPSVSKSDSSTAASIRVEFLNLATTESVTVEIAAASALPTGGNLSNTRLFFIESTTSVAGDAPAVDTATGSVAAAGVLTVESHTGTREDNFRIASPAAANATSSVLVKVSLG